MIWKTECSRIKNLLALSAGRDIDEEEAAETRRHVSHCAHCREHAQKMEGSQRLLEQVAATAKLPAGNGDTSSIWPQVRARLLAQQARSARQTFNGWLPVGALAAACLAILVVTQTPQTGQQYADQRPHLVQPVMNVSPGMSGGAMSRGVPPGGQAWDRNSPDMQNRYDWTQNNGGLNFGAEPRRIGPAEAGQGGF